MPKISTEQIGFEGTTFIRVVNCSSEGEFTCKLPASVAVLLNIGQATGKSKVEVLRHWQELVDRYGALKTVKRKVILFDVKSTVSIYGTDNNATLITDEISFCTGAAISVCAGNFYEIEITHANGRKVFKYEEADTFESSPYSKSFARDRGLTPRYGDRASKRLDWTREREDFFVRLGSAIDRIAMSLEGLKQADDVAKVIESASIQHLLG